MKAPVPPETTYDSFQTRYVTGPDRYDQPYTIMLVPSESLEAYKQVEVFDKNWNIMTSLPIDINEINDAKQDEENSGEAIYYDLSGRRVENPAHGLYIIGGKKVFVP